MKLERERVREKSDLTFVPHSCHSPLLRRDILLQKRDAWALRGSGKSSHRPQFVAGEEEETGTVGEVMECVCVCGGGGGVARPPALSKAELDK
jgi:hypothetical protein